MKTSAPLSTKTHRRTNNSVSSLAATEEFCLGGHSFLANIIAFGGEDCHRGPGDCDQVEG